MPATLTRHQERWNEIVRDPALRDLSYKVETNERGQLILSPHKNRHSHLQSHLFQHLMKHAPDGFVSVEYAIATPKGVKSADVVWMSRDREAEMDATGDPTTLAPEICVEVMNDSNTGAEMEEKRRLYFEAAAEEVWIVGEDGAVRFYDADGPLEQSRIAPECPSRIEV